MNTTNLTAIEVYKLVLNGTRKRFPKYFWESATLQDKKDIIQFLFNNILEWSIEDVKTKLTAKLFIDNKLSKLLFLYDNSPYALYNLAFPDAIKPWELKKTPKHYWNNKTVTQALKWLIEFELKWSDNDVKIYYCVKLLDNYNLGGMLEHYNNCPYTVLDIAYPGKFKPWELNRSPKHTWTKEQTILALKWLINKYGIDTKDITATILLDKGLGGALSYYKNNVSQYLKAYRLDYKYNKT